MLENTPVEAEISCDQLDWFSSLEEELTQVQKDLSFYNNILKEFTAKDIVSLELDFKGNIIQGSSVVRITVNAMATMNITVDAVILDDVSVAIDSCIWQCCHGT